MTSPRHFLDIWPIGAADLRAMLDDAKRRKAARAGWGQARVDADAPAAGRTLAMIFQKNSTRTRFSFDAGIRQLGGASIIATASDMQLGRGETIEDTAKVLSRMVDAVMIRANSHKDIVGFAGAASVPVINGLSDRSHPCQIMADLMTYEEHRGTLEGKTFAWIGDGNNMAASFLHAAGAFGFKFIIACPKGYEPKADDVARAPSHLVEITHDTRAAARGADCVLSDSWVSMGDPDHEERQVAFQPYQVNAELMALAKPEAVFMHCLPAHRGEEVTDEVMDGPQSLVWDEAENRLHAQKSILAWCFGAI